MLWSLYSAWLLVRKSSVEWCLVIQVMEAPVSNNHENVFPPAMALTLGLILSPLKGVIWSKHLLHVAMEIVHKFKINCGMTLGAFMRGAMTLFNEKPIQLHWDCCFVARYWDYYWWSSLLASKVVPCLWHMVCCHWFVYGILPGCD